MEGGDDCYGGGIFASIRRSMLFTHIMIFSIHTRLSRWGLNKLKYSDREKSCLINFPWEIIWQIGQDFSRSPYIYLRSVIVGCFGQTHPCFIPHIEDILTSLLAHFHK